MAKQKSKIKPQNKQITNQPIEPEVEVIELSSNLSEYIEVEKYPLDENRTETVEVDWKNKTSYIAYRYGLKDSLDLEYLKTIAKETLVDSDRYLFEDIKKLTINELISLIEKELSQKNKHLMVLTVFIQRFAGLITQSVFELAESLEIVGLKNSTFNQIDILRQRITDTLNDLTVLKPAEGRPGGARAVMRELSVRESKLQDLLETILKEIMVCDPLSETKPIPIPIETASKLRKQAESLRQYAVQFPDYQPFETLTDELRKLAGYLKHADSSNVNMDILRRANELSWCCLALWSDLKFETEYIPNRKSSTRTVGERILTDSERDIVICLNEAHEILDNIVIKRTWSADCPDRLQGLANDLDKCPPIKRYKDFSNMLKPAKGERAAAGGTADITAKEPTEDRGDKIKREPLSKNAQIVYNILIKLQPTEALIVSDILDQVSKIYRKEWDEKELYNRVFPQLKPWGLKNKPRVGYWIEKEEKSSDAPS